MNMETVRLANVSWHWISDGQVFALREAWLSRPWATGTFFSRLWSREYGSPAELDIRSGSEPRPLPTLDWPADLFADETVER